MTTSGVVIGLFLLALGFLMVWKRRYFREYMGDLGSLFDLPGTNWLTWEALGSIVMLIGFFSIFGIFQAVASKILRGLIVPSM